MVQVVGRVVQDVGRWFRMWLRITLQGLTFGLGGPSAAPPPSPESGEPRLPLGGDVLGSGDVISSDSSEFCEDGRPVSGWILVPEPFQIRTSFVVHSIFSWYKFKTEDFYNCLTGPCFKSCTTKILDGPEKTI